MLVRLWFRISINSTYNLGDQTPYLRGNPVDDRTRSRHVEGKDLKEHKEDKEGEKDKEPEEKKETKVNKDERQHIVPSGDLLYPSERDFYALTTTNPYRYVLRYSPSAMIAIACPYGIAVSGIFL